MFKLLYSFLIFTVYAAQAHTSLSLIPSLTNTTVNEIEDYRLGDEWGKKKVTAETLKEESPSFVRASQATAYLPVGGTGFYLGKFAGVHILATNHHVCPSRKHCIGSKASFKILDKSFKMTKMFISEKSIDMALIAIDIPVEDEALMKSVSKNFSFDKEINKGQELITVGFGIGGNRRNNLMGNQDHDCKVFSETDEYKYLGDPDELNPGRYKAWSFAHACDISHGDSGSAVVDRASGDVLGIIWTGKFPKERQFQRSSYLNEILQKSSAAIWKELSYAVPAKKIAAYLQESILDPEYDEEAKKVFRKILTNDL
jgi:hypothetical protein